MSKQFDTAKCEFSDEIVGVMMLYLCSFGLLKNVEAEPICQTEETSSPTYSIVGMLNFPSDMLAHYSGLHNHTYYTKRKDRFDM